ncbi:MAG: heparan-alpha-glucosaminide N-acetyltransferase domain-containing protein [Syntrophobacteraceae bacterium]
MRIVSLTTQAPAQQKRFANEKPELQGCFSSQTEKCLERQPHPTPDSGLSAPKGRLASLDAFRGFTIALMILVNSPGDTKAVYAPLSHADWNGWTFADTVFPSFLFIVGVSLVFSFAKQEEKGKPNSAFVVRLLRRTLILFALGLFLNVFPTFYLSTIRIPGVLQRIALCYFFASLIVLKADLRGCILWLIGLLASYWLMMRFIPVPGIGAGVLEPGKNFAAWVDSLFLSGHMWSYYNGTWDPEGIVSTIPAIATTLFGVLTGQWLSSSLPERRKVAGMVCAGLVLLIAGYILDRWLPINKSIWTSTFSIFMAGMALVCLAFFHWSIDVADFSRWAKPFIILGLNPIAVYVLSEVFDTTLRILNLPMVLAQNIDCQSYVFNSLCSPIAKSETASLLYALLTLLFMFLIAWIMWRKRLFITI